MSPGVLSRKTMLPETSPRLPTPSLGFPQSGEEFATALSSECFLSTPAMLLLLANPCSHPAPIPLSSPAPPPASATFQQQKVLEPGSQCAPFDVRAENATPGSAQFPKQAEPLGLSDRGH